MFYGSYEVTKLQVCCEILALLYLLANKNQDKVRVILLLNNRRIEFQSQRGKQGLISFIAGLEREGIIKKDGKINRDKQFEIQENSEKLILKELKNFVARRKETLLLSDFMWLQDSRDLDKLLGNSRLHSMAIYSPLDLKPLEFSFVQGSRFGVGTSFNHNNYRNKKIPHVLTNEKYLEFFIRRLN
jgi:hypothetical protein